MYAIENSVRTLCINVRSGLDTAFILEMGAMADAVIDAKMSERYQWPIDNDGNPTNAAPLNVIIQIANRLTASYCERTKYAINDANGQPMGNPYAASLEKQANSLLNDIIEGSLVIHELPEITPLRQSAAKQSFTPIRGTIRGSFGTRQ